MKQAPFSLLISKIGIGAYYPNFTLCMLFAYYFYCYYSYKENISLLMQIVLTFSEMQ